MRLLQDPKSSLCFCGVQPNKRLKLTGARK